MGWIYQQGAPSTSQILWPTRVPGRGSPTPDSDGRTGTPYSGYPQALLMTDWVGAVGGKLFLYSGTDQTLLQTIRVDFDGDPPHLPYRITLDEAGLSMPDVWSMMLKTTNGQFDAFLIFRDQ